MLEIDKILKQILIDPFNSSDLKFNFSSAGKISAITNYNGKKININRGVIDLVDGKNYTDNFGDQWTRYPNLQLDSHNGTSISQDRFWGALKLSPSDLRNKLILDVGCGTGRFAEIALQAGAKVIGLDYSTAAYVAAKNLDKYPNFRAIRADIYNLPFKKNSFDIVYCLGVLQHTPNVEKAFKCLPPMVRSPGHLVVDYYWKRLKNILNWKYVIRPFTSNLNEKTVLKILKLIHPVVYPVSELFSKIPYIGKTISRLLPVVNYVNDYKQLNRQQLREWSFLDTYDNWAPKYDKPQTLETVKKWAIDSGLKNIQIEHFGHLVVRGTIKN